MKQKELLEILSDLEHQQWEDWSKAIAKLLHASYVALDTKKESQIEDVKSKIADKLRNWNSYWVPYEDLTDEIKEYDRVYARKIINVLKGNDGR